MICTLSCAHWQQASKGFQPCSVLSLFGKIEINVPINTVIIIEMSETLVLYVTSWTEWIFLYHSHQPLASYCVSTRLVKWPMETARSEKKVNIVCLLLQSQQSSKVSRVQLLDNCSRVQLDNCSTVQLLDNWLGGLNYALIAINRARDIHEDMLVTASLSFLPATFTTA